MNSLDYISKMFTQKEELSREEHAVCRALIGCMSKDEMLQLKLKVPLDWHLSNYLENKMNGCDTRLLFYRVAEHEHNKDWRYYLKHLQNRSAGQVCKYRNKLETLFPHLKWKDQLTLLRYFICSNLKIDRRWGLNTIRWDWNLISDCSPKQFKEWEQIIEDVWVKYNDKAAAFLILRRFPLSFVEKYADKLIDVTDYKSVAYRLGENPDYVIDSTKLAGYDYLYLMAKHSRKVSLKTARNVLTELLITISTGEISCFTRLSTSLSLFSDSRIGLCIWCLGKLNLPSLIIDFCNKDKSLQSAISFTPDDDYNSKMHYWMIMCEKIKYVFADYYLEYMQSNNSSMNWLIGDLQLGVCKGA